MIKPPLRRITFLRTTFVLALAQNSFRLPLLLIWERPSVKLLKNRGIRSPMSAVA
jgi:hypothetical protein